MLRIVHYVAKGNRTITDYEKLITLQKTNAMDLGAVLHGRTTSTYIPQTADKLTFVSKKSCLILYLRAKVDNESPQNIFLQVVGLSDKGVEVICDTILKILENSGNDNAFL